MNDSDESIKTWKINKMHTTVDVINRKLIVMLYVACIACWQFTQ